jgi:MinD superfamily P-loop ATPase
VRPARKAGAQRRQPGERAALVMLHLRPIRAEAVRRVASVIPLLRAIRPLRPQRAAAVAAVAAAAAVAHPVGAAVVVVEAVHVVVVIVASPTMSGWDELRRILKEGRNEAPEKGNGTSS